VDRVQASINKLKQSAQKEDLKNKNATKKEAVKKNVKSVLIKKEPQNQKFQTKTQVTKYSKIIKIKKEAPTYATPIFIPKFSQFKTYTPIETYFKFIYYTQPIGLELFYDETMSSYETCSYVNGISTCERYVSLPSSFSIDSHNNYYGIRFDQCTN
jgi:hypothetical protein